MFRCRLGARVGRSGRIRRGGRLNTELINAVVGALDMSRVMIELPGPWISGVSLAQVYDMRKLLVKAFGPDVNIANVKPDDVFDTEALRVGLGVVGPQVT